MPEQENDHIHYGAADFERYHSGNMTEREMHALEKAALDDPFLADALEGYLHTSTPVADIREIKKKLLQQEEDRKVVGLRQRTMAPLLRIAAILILVAGFSWLMYNNSGNKNTAAPEYADQHTTGKDKRKTDTTAAKQAEGYVAIEPSIQQQKTVPLKNKTVSTGATTYTWNTTNNALLADSLKTGNANYYANAEQAQTNNNVDKTLLPGFRDVNTKQGKNRKQNSNNQDLDNTLAGKTASVPVTAIGTGTDMVTLKGKVIDDKGKAVPFATIVDEKSRRGISTDADGKFELIKKDSTEVAVNAAGYKTVIKKLVTDSNANNIVMTEGGNTIKEVIVTSAFGTKRAARSTASNVVNEGYFKKAEEKRITVTNAIPVNGWQGFDTYVNDSLKTIRQLAPASVSAEVSVTFDVNDKGEPVDVRVKRSVCPACDEEAARIIKNSPPWHLNKKRKKANAVVRF